MNDSCVLFLMLFVLLSNEFLFKAIGLTYFHLFLDGCKILQSQDCLLQVDFIDSSDLTEKINFNNLVVRIFKR